MIFLPQGRPVMNVRRNYIVQEQKKWLYFPFPQQEQKKDKNSKVSIIWWTPFLWNERNGIGHTSLMAVILFFDGEWAIFRKFCL